MILHATAAPAPSLALATLLAERGFRDTTGPSKPGEAHWFDRKAADGRTIRVCLPALDTLATVYAFGPAGRGQDQGPMVFTLTLDAGPAADVVFAAMVDAALTHLADR